MNKQEHIGYDPSTLSPGVVHIGLGGFARGFVLDFLHDLAVRGHKDVGVIAIKPRTEHEPEFDDPKNWPYTLVTGDCGSPENQHNIAVLRGVIGSKGSSKAAVERLANPETKLITLTIMPHGYCMDGSNPDMQQLGHDVVAIKKGHIDDIHTGPGLVVAALYKRFNKGMEPPAIMSMDNMLANGDVVKTVIQTMAGEIKREFGDYAERLCCPNTVVDRIVPPCPADSPLRACPEIPGQSILTEKNRSLFIENSFPAGALPPFHEVGAHLVDDIHSAEKLKLRMVNGGHLALAVVAKVMNIEKVCDAVNADKNPALRCYVEQFIDQAGQAIRPVPAIDLESHRQKTVQRFEDNQTDDVDRLLTSTHGKVIPRLFNKSALNRGLDCDVSAFAIAAWMHYMQRHDEKGRRYGLKGDDVRAKPIEKVWELEILLRPAVPDLDAKILRNFANAAVDYYEDMRDRGVRAVLEEKFTPPGSAPSPAQSSPLSAKSFQTFPIASPA